MHPNNLQKLRSFTGEGAWADERYERNIESVRPVDGVIRFLSRPLLHGLLLNGLLLNGLFVGTQIGCVLFYLQLEAGIGRYHKAVITAIGGPA